jgi:hypothetical protein
MKLKIKVDGIMKEIDFNIKDNAMGGDYSANRTYTGDATGGYHSANTTIKGDATGGYHSANTTITGNATGGDHSANTTTEGNATGGNNSVNMGQVVNIGNNAIGAVINKNKEIVEIHCRNKNGKLIIIKMQDLEEFLK